MNGKISKIQFGMILSLLCCSMHLGLGDIILLNKSKNSVLVSIIIGIIIGLIPILMYLKVNSCFPEKNIYQKNIKLFGRYLGNLFNIFFIVMYIIMLCISIRSIVLFITSKYLQDTPFIILGLLFMLTTIIICFCSLEGIARVLRMCFILSVIFMLIVEILLLKYINLDNVFPIIINSNKIIDGASYFISQTAILSVLLLSINKSKINNTKNFNLTTILFYMFGCISLFVSMFFVISSFGYNMGTLFRYPEYIILKKITLSNTDLHLENLLAFRWNFYMLALSVISLYGIITGIKTYSKNRKLNKKIILIISVICILISKNFIKDVTHSIIFMKNNYASYIALPIFIVLTIIFIRCLCIKKT